MARYHYTRENENGVVLYLESEPAEDAMDEFDLSGWRVIGHYGCGRGYEGRSWYDMGKPFGRR